MVESARLIGSSSVASRDSPRLYTFVEGLGSIPDLGLGIGDAYWPKNPNLQVKISELQSGRPRRNVGVMGGGRTITRCLVQAGNPHAQGHARSLSDARVAA